jgi:hypothetical protein
MALEIYVYDEVHVSDDFNEAVEFVVETIKKWFESDEVKDLEVVMKKIGDRSPPALEINVGENVKVVDKVV